MAFASAFAKASADRRCAPIGHLVFRTFGKKAHKSCEAKELSAKTETHEKWGCLNVFEQV